MAEFIAVFGSGGPVVAKVGLRASNAILITELLNVAVGAAAIVVAVLRLCRGGSGKSDARNRHDGGGRQNCRKISHLFLLYRFEPRTAAQVAQCLMGYWRSQQELVERSYFARCFKKKSAMR